MNTIEEMKNKPFDLDDDLLSEYPEMQALSGIPVKEAPRDTWTVSAAYVNLRSVERRLPDVEAGRKTIGIEYALQLVGKCLDELAATEKYDGFVSTERQKFDQLSSRASETIGDKVRGMDSVYR